MVGILTTSEAPLPIRDPAVALIISSIPNNKSILMKNILCTMRIYTEKKDC